MVSTPELTEVRRPPSTSLGSPPPPEAAPLVRSRLSPHLLAAVATLLTATGLIRVFDGFFWWYLPCAGGVLVVVVCGWLGRVGRVPPALQPLVYLAGLALLVVLGTFAVACAVDMISTRFRAPATAGLPLLALLAVPAAIVPGDV